MASNLLKNNHKIVVFDVSPATIKAAKDKGMAVAATPKALAAECDTVITMLPGPAHVRSVYESSTDGIFAGLRPKSLLIDSSTIDPATAQAVASAAAKHSAGAEMVDAPVSGGVGGAAAGTLTFMVGGTDSAFNRAKPVLSCMGKNIVHCGGNGTGQVAKVCNNLVLAISMIGVSEGMAMGVRLGMDGKKLAGILNTSTGRCWSSDTYNPCPGVMENVPSSRGYTGGFGVDLMKKDLGLAIDAARSVNLPLPLGSQALQLYQHVSAAQNGQKDFSFVYEYLRQIAEANTPKKQ